MTATVTVTTEVAYVAWPTPDRAALAMPTGLKQDGFQPLPQIPLKDLAPHVLDALAKQWLAHLYASVERPSPFKQETPE